MALIQTCQIQAIMTVPQLHWPFYVTEPIPLHTKTNPVEQQFPLAIERVQSQTELLRSLCLKRVGKLPRHDEADE